MGSGFRVQRYEEKTRYVEKFREKRRIICKFMCISVRMICKSLLISVRIVSFFCSKAQTTQGSFTLLPFYLSMSLPEKQKLLPLHYEITRKRTLGNRKKTIGKSYKND